MRFDKIRKVICSFFAMIIFWVITTSGVQAQCDFFTGWVDNKNGTVTDTRNGLIWKRCAEGFDFKNGICSGVSSEASWEDAKLMAQQSHFLDKSDWRLPTKEEFEAVLGNYEECKKNRDGEYAASKAIAHLDTMYFWSASSGSGDPDYAWEVDFGNGKVSESYRSRSFDVRLVRSGQVLGGDASSEFVNEVRIKEERRRSDSLRAMSNDEICAAYGNVLREDGSNEIGSSPDIAKLVKRELARRKLKLNDSLARKELIKMGISECQLFASWGMPEDQNRTVGSWGVHIQHIYGSETYVYTENGRVTSWQD